VLALTCASLQDHWRILLGIHASCLQVIAALAVVDIQPRLKLADVCSAAVAATSIAACAAAPAGQWHGRVAVLWLILRLFALCSS
jgi:predicted MFS family arabinose efflux permease